MYPIATARHTMKMAAPMLWSLFTFCFHLRLAST
jgi:hypothetical protein